MNKQEAQQRLLKGLVAVGGGVGFLHGLFYLLIPLQWQVTDLVYRKDWVQEYLFGKALLNGEDPYQPIYVLAKRYLEASVYKVFPHPTPHPPTLGLLILPFSLIEYRAAAALWAGVEIACILASFYLLLKASGWHVSAPRVLVITVIALGWHPFVEELFLGQVTSILLLLLSGMWLACKEGKRTLAGLFLGLAVLIKPTPWPLALLLLLRRDWRALLTSFATVFLGYLGTGCALGFDRLGSYFRVLPAVQVLYRSSPINLSVATIGWRLFSGTGSPVHYWLTAPPLVHSPTAAAVVSVCVPLLVLLAGLLAVWKQQDLGASIGVLVCVSILISLVSWDHYLLLACIPATVVLAWLRDHHWPRKESTIALLVAVLFYFSVHEWEGIAFWLVGRKLSMKEMGVIPFAPALLTQTLTLGLVCLGCLVALLPGRGARGKSAPDVTGPGVPTPLA